MAAATIADYNISARLLPISLGFPDGTTLQVSYEKTPGYSTYTGRLGQLTLREGGAVAYGYSGSNNGMNCTYLVPPTLTRTTADGTTTYTWQAVNNGSGNWGNTTTVTDQGGNATVYTFTGLTSTGNAALPVTQALTQVSHYQGSSTQLSTDVYCYNALSGQPGNCPTAVVSAPITEVDIYHTISGMNTASRTQTEYDEYGNVTYFAQYDFGGTSPTIATSTVYGSCSASCTTSNPTMAAIGSNINDRPGRKLTIGGGSTIADTRYTYDTHGNLLTTYVWNGSSWLYNTTPNTYNSNGTAATVYDLANNKTSFSYSSGSYVSCSGCTNYPFPTSISKGGLTTSSTWNGTGGVKLTDTDPNNNTTTYAYTACTGGAADPFWRLMSATDPLGNEVCKTYPSGSSPDTYNTTLSSGGTTLHNTTTTMDRYGRTIDVQTESSATTYDTATSSYGWSENYRQVSTSQPCSTSSIGATCATVHTSNLDPLGRLYQESTTNNETVTHTYTQNDDLAVLSPAPSGENTKQAQNQYDGLGRLTSSCEISSSASGNVSCGQNTNTTATGILTATTYSYATGSSTITMARGVQSRSRTYDALGRVTQVVTPEGGTTNYVYDSVCGGGSSNGDLTQKSDADGYQICYYYDGLHRLTNVGNNDEGATNNLNPCRRFQYDSPSNGVVSQPSGSTIANVAGRLVEAETDNCQTPYVPITDEWFSYDTDGHLTDVWESTPHSSGYYHTTATYFGNGTISTLAGIPGYSTVTFGIDGEGRYATSELGTTGLIGTTPSGITYTAAQQPSTIPLAGGDSDTYSYDPNTGGTRPLALA